MNGIDNFHAFEVWYPKATGKLKALIHRKLQCIDPAQFEHTGFLDDLNKAQKGAEAIPYFASSIYLIFSFYGIYFASMGAYLFNLKPMLIITLLIAFIPAMLANIVRVRVFTKLEEQSAPLRRENEYYQKTMCDREYFKETRILGAYKYFRKLFTDTLALLTHKTWQAERKTALLQLLLNVISFAGMAVASYMLFSATMLGDISVGAFAAVFVTLSSLFEMMQEIITSHLGNMNKDTGKVANFIRLLDMPEKAGAYGTPDFSHGIAASNISFIYPGKDIPAVKNVSLVIANGETIAIVGENGAGKSTLVRLLTGIYRPSEGKVTIGGLDTAKTHPTSVYQGISGVFQKFQRYKMTLEENIVISDIATLKQKSC